MRSSVLESLKDWLESDTPNESGEIGMFCPMHDDDRRSASLNVHTGVWYCHACNQGGSANELVRILPELERLGKSKSRKKKKNASGLPSEAKIQGWASALFADKNALRQLQDRRGFSKQIIKRFDIGWDVDAGAYTIPVRDAEGILVNVRRYVFDPPDGRRKIWSVAGHGEPTLYPAQLIETWGKAVVICEGEWDALLTIQHGFSAVTRTGAAKVWKKEWNKTFKDKMVFVCHDMDATGQAANLHVADEVSKYAKEARIITLPYEVTDKHGRDLSDYWLDGHTHHNFVKLAKEARGAPLDEPPPALAPPTMAPTDVSVLDSFDARRVGETLRLRVTITGKKNPPYLIPAHVTYNCTQSLGPKCQICPMSYEFDGAHALDIAPDDPTIQEFMNASTKSVKDLLRERIGAQKCPILDINFSEQVAVEELFVRPSVERSSTSTESGDYTTRKVISVGRHDSMPNNTVEMVGSIYASPKTQHNEFQAWEVVRTETSIDRFDLDKATASALKIFRPEAKQTPLQKMSKIAKDLATHVTNIYGRTAMHVFMDLVWHSVVGFEFGGVMQERGWLDGLIVGDTRTGKSEAAQKLIRHYSAGEMISCESASYAGVVGGLEQYGGKEWVVKWGAIPLNDRRLVVLDEVSGLTSDQIAQMSSIRSSGEAQLTKIQSERTWARTRLLWLANPRNGRMSDFTYGVQTILPLVGTNEDVARYDMAMSVAAHEVNAEVINQMHQEKSSQVYPADLCQALVTWVWSRTPEDVMWAPGAQEVVYEQAIAMGQRYVETPPLVQAANVRIKISRIAVALAARTFSTDKSYQKVLVTADHVRDAVRFLDLIYGSEGFGYGAISQELIEDQRRMEDLSDLAREYVYTTPGIAKFLRSNPVFRNQDMQDMLNLSKEEASARISKMWELRMLIRKGADYKINPELHQLLRDVKDN